MPEGVARAEVVREGEREAEDARQLCAVAARTEQPDGRLVAPAGDGRDPGVGVALGEATGEERHELAEGAREVLVGERVGRAAQRACRDAVGSRGAADPEVDAAGVEGLEHPELLGDHQRGMVREHHPTRSDPDRLRLGRERRRQHGRRGARDPGHVVVLGDPMAVIAEPFGCLRQLDRVGEGVGRGRALADDRQVEHGDRDAAVGRHRGSLASLRIYPGRRSTTSAPCSVTRRAAISERWHASGSRSTQKRAGRSWRSRSAASAAASTASRISAV